MATGLGVIRLSFYFEMTTEWGCHPVVILFWNDNRMTYSSGCHFFWNVNRMEIPSGSYFFTRINRIGSIVELKFYIRVQEEDIRVQEEFVWN